MGNTHLRLRDATCVAILDRYLLTVGVIDFNSLTTHNVDSTVLLDMFFDSYD